VELDDSDVVEGKLHVLQHLGRGEGRTQQKLCSGRDRTKQNKKEQMIKQDKLMPSCIKYNQKNAG